MIRLSQETREKLKYVGKKGETYDQIISRLFYEHLTDEKGYKNTSEYEQQRLLRVAKTRTDEELQQLIVDADANIEEFRGRAERWKEAVEAWENEPLDVLIYCNEDGGKSAYEWTILGALIDKKLAEVELRRRTGEP